MADMAASVLERLKNKAAGAISSACGFFARKSSCAVWKSQNMQKISF